MELEWIGRLRRSCTSLSENERIVEVFASSKLSQSLLTCCLEIFGQ